MPTIAEPYEPVAVIIRGTTLGPEILDAVIVEFQERGVAVTPLGVLAHLLDAGVPEAIAVQLTAAFEHEEEARLACR